MMKNKYSVPTVIILAASILIGAGSMLFLVCFLFAGPVEWIHTDLNTWRKLAWNATLCLVFFFQHSIMIRQFFKDRLRAWIPLCYHGAFYSIASGLALYVLIIFWQPIPNVLVVFPDWVTWCLYSLFFSTGLIFYFSVKALPSLDPLGLEPLIRSRPPLNESERSPSAKLLIKGPYRWVRHPLYLSFIIAAWSTPHITVDRLLFNVLWTMWIYGATHLEEKDLILIFGDSYRDYQANVPMIFPKGIRPRA